MTNINFYIKDIKKLINSLTIKLDMQAIYMQANIEKIYGYYVEDKREYKYYLNLTGEKFKYDPDVITYIPDIKDYGVVNKDNINSYPMLRDDLLQYDVTYNNLIKLYPTMATYIKGILNPIDMDALLNKEDGSILYYNKNLIDETELNIVADIENFIKNFISSYNIREYVIDELYIPGLLSNLYSKLLLNIIAIRFKNILTYKAYSFDIYKHIESYNYINKDDLSFINKNSLLWLYGNRDRIKTDIGHNEILEDISKHIFEDNNIGISKINYNIKPPMLNIDNFDKKEKSYYNKDYTFSIEKYNNAVFVNNKTMELSTLLDAEKNNGYVDKHNVDTLAKNYDKDLRLDNKYTANTKDFIFNNLLLNKFYTDTTITIIINELLHKLHDPDFNFSIRITSITDGSLITLDKEKTYYLILANMFLLMDIDINQLYINKYEAYLVPNEQFDFNVIKDKLFYKDKLKPFADRFSNTLKYLGSIKTTDGLKLAVSNIRKIISEMLTILSNANDYILISDLHKLYNVMFKEIEYPEIYSNLTLGEILNKLFNKDLDLRKDKAFDYVKYVIKTIFDITVDEYAEIISMYKKYSKIANAYKSYTVKFIYDTSSLRSFFTYYNNNVIGTQQQIINSIKGWIKPYKKTFVNMDALDIPYKDIYLYWNDYKQYVKIQAYTKLKLISHRCNIIDCHLLTGSREASFNRYKPINNETTSVNDHSFIAISGSDIMLNNLDEIKNETMIADAVSIINDDLAIAGKLTKYEDWRSKGIGSNYVTDVDNLYLNNLDDYEIDTPSKSMLIKEDNISTNDPYINKPSTYNKYQPDSQASSINDISQLDKESIIDKVIIDDEKSSIMYEQLPKESNDDDMNKVIKIEPIFTANKIKK